MISQSEKKRVARQLVLPGFGEAGQQRLAQASVVVIGAGGLGCPLLLSLAGAGIGEITIVDDDVVSVSNIHRQTLFGVDDAGQPKASLAAQRLAGLHPEGNFRAEQTRFCPENALNIVAGADMLVDASDNFATKFLSADAAEITGLPLVWGTVLRFEGQVGLCRSGAGVSEGVGFRDLYPKLPPAEFIPDNASVGVLGATTAVLGNLMATEVIKFLVGIGDSKPGLLLSYDALSASLRRAQITASNSRQAADKLG